MLSNQQYDPKTSHYGLKMFLLWFLLFFSFILKHINLSHLLNCPHWIFFFCRSFFNGSLNHLFPSHDSPFIQFPVYRLNTLRKLPTSLFISQVSNLILWLASNTAMTHSVPIYPHPWQEQGEQTTNSIHFAITPLASQNLHFFHLSNRMIASVYLLEQSQVAFILF